VKASLTRDSDHKLDSKKDAAKIAARIAASSQIVRFRADDGSAASSMERTGKLRETIAHASALAPS